MELLEPPHPRHTQAANAAPSHRSHPGLPSGSTAARPAISSASDASCAASASRSGGIAERARFGPQLMATGVIVGFVYPLFEGVAWNQAFGIQAWIKSLTAPATSSMGTSG